MTDLTNKLDVDTVEGLVLARDALGKDVVNEPSQVHSLLILSVLAACSSFGTSVRGISGLSLLFCFGNNQFTDGVSVLIEIVLASVVAFELDLINHILSRLLK